VTTAPLLHIVGCGRAGRTLARLWAEAGVFRIGCIVNDTKASAGRAAAFIGAGRAAGALDGVEADEWLMLAVPDGALESAAGSLAENLHSPPALAFHISGAVPAEVLRPLGCPVAAVHPVCPFADPQAALASFAGSHALGEGDAAALDRVLPAFAAIGARIGRFRPSDKRLYHAATIAASNFLNVLDALALDLAEAGGVAPEVMQPVLVSLQRTALDNIERSGPAAALTGPIERGDGQTCQLLMDSLDEVDVEHRKLFRQLGLAALALARRKHGAGPSLDALQPIFDRPEPDDGRV